jgi:hypothetical protein
MSKFGKMEAIKLFEGNILFEFCQAQVSRNHFE